MQQLKNVSKLGLVESFSYHNLKKVLILPSVFANLDEKDRKLFFDVTEPFDAEEVNTYTMEKLIDQFMFMNLYKSHFESS